MDEPTTPRTDPAQARPAAENTQESARLSGTALASFLLVLGSILLGCGSLAGSIFAGWNSWVGVLAAPLLALNGCVLAFISLRSIERTPHLLGRPLALVALFVGVGVTAIQGALVLLALVTLSASSTLAPVGAELVGSAQADRPGLTRQVLSEELAQTLSDEQIRAFGAVIREQRGKVTGSGAGFGLIIDARRVFAEAGPLDGYDPEAAEMPRPIYLRFGDDRLLAYVYTDPEALRDQSIRIRDMVVLFGGGEVAVLAPDGPGSELAAAAGWRIIQPSETPGQDRILE
jgi:hypothetical protein